MLSDISQNPTDSADPIVSLLLRKKADRLSKKYMSMASQKRTAAGPQNVTVNTPYGAGTIQIGGAGNLGLGSTNLSSSDGSQPSFVG